MKVSKVSNPNMLASGKFINVVGVKVGVEIGIWVRSRWFSGADVRVRDCVYVKM